jgi:hypothetical protein
MPEIVAFVNRGAASITPAIVEKVLRHLPQWKLEFTQIYEPLFPHLVDQLSPGHAVEDSAEGAHGHPYVGFAWRFAHLPQESGHHSRLDSEPGPRCDSSVVRAVLIQTKAFDILRRTQAIEGPESQSALGGWEGSRGLEG